MIIDATNMVLGRLAAIVAKQALKGETISVINCEKAVITGTREKIFESYISKFDLGQVNQGPYFPRRPDMLVRRVIRGMLPRKKPRGVLAFGRVQCFVGVPAGIKSGEAKAMPEANVQKVKKVGHVSIEELCLHIGYKK
jgi:large subunit ribosomal protein L13